jgi:hypothetical protein
MAATSPIGIQPVDVVVEVPAPLLVVGEVVPEESRSVTAASASAIGKMGEPGGGPVGVIGPAAPAAANGAMGEPGGGPVEVPEDGPCGVARANGGPAAPDAAIGQVGEPGGGPRGVPEDGPPRVKGPAALDAASGQVGEPGGGPFGVPEDGPPQVGVGGTGPCGVAGLNGPGSAIIHTRAKPLGGQNKPFGC